MKNREIKEKLKVLDILVKKRVNIGYLICLYDFFVFHGYGACIIYTLEKYNNDLEFYRQLTKRELVDIIFYFESNRLFSN